LHITRDTGWLTLLHVRYIQATSFAVPVFLSRSLLLSLPACPFFSKTDWHMLSLTCSQGHWKLRKPLFLCIRSSLTWTSHSLAHTERTLPHPKP
jgi:hypothetical protein